MPVLQFGIWPAMFFLLLALGTGTLAAQECSTFRRCYDLAGQAKEAGNVDVAIRLYSAACAKQVERVYGALKIAACNYVITLSGESDDYATAEAFFSRRCDSGADEGCFFLGKMAEDRDSLAEALAIMQPLCAERFKLPVVHGYDACSHVRRIERVFEVRNPKPPRTGPLQLGAFFAIFVATAASALAGLRFIATRNLRVATGSVALSVLSLVVYGYYESGIPGHYAIRIDLLLIFPALVLNLLLIAAATIGAAVVSRKASSTA